MKKKPRFLKEHPGKIKEAFVYDNKTYYCFEDSFSMPTIRGLVCLDLYDEFSMRCTRDFLKAHTAAVREILSNNKKLDLIKLGQLIRNLEERLEMIPTNEHIYRLASVVFFTAEEDPFSYDRKKAQEKIKVWKENPEILSFFLRTQLKDLMPQLPMRELSSKTYSDLQEAINQTHLKAVSLPSLGKNMNCDM